MTSACTRYQLLPAPACCLFFSSFCSLFIHPLSLSHHTTADDHLARDARKQLEAGGASFFYDRVSLQQVDGRQPHVRLASACDEYHQALALKDHTNASRILATILGLLRLVYGPLHPRVCTCHLALTRVYLEQLNQVDIAYHHACKSKEMLRKLKAVASDSVQLQLATWAIVARTALEAGKLQEATQCIQETKTLLTSEAEGASPHIVWYIHLTAALVGEAAGDEARALDDAHVALSALEDAERSAGDASNKEGATHNDAMLRERDPLDPFSPTQLYDDMGVAWIWTLTTAGRLLAKNGDESQHVFDKALQLCEVSRFCVDDVTMTSSYLTCFYVHAINRTVRTAPASWLRSASSDAHRR